MATDSHLSETERVMAEASEAREAYLANRDDGLAKARNDRAMEALRATRQFWREVGVMVGDRPADIDGVPVVGIRTADGEANAPTLTEGN